MDAVVETWWQLNQGYIYTFLLSLIPTSIAGFFSWYKWMQLDKRNRKVFMYDKESEYRKHVDSLKEAFWSCGSSILMSAKISDADKFKYALNNDELYSSLNRMESTLKIFMHKDDSRLKIVTEIKQILDNKEFKSFDRLSRLIKQS